MSPLQSGPFDQPDSWAHQPLALERPDEFTADQEQFHTLMERVRQGSNDASWELIERYAPHIRAVVRKRLHQRLRSVFDSEDFLQLVWASFIRVRTQLGSIDRPEQLVQLLVSVARNKVINESRRRVTGVRWSIHRERRDFKVAAYAGRNPTPSEIVMAKELWHRLVQSQPAQTKRILQLRVEGSSYTQIAKTLNVHEWTVRRIVENLLSVFTTVERPNC